MRVTVQMKKHMVWLKMEKHIKYIIIIIQGVCKYRNYQKNIAHIVSDSFVDFVVAKGANTNRIMEECEVIFIPESKGWKDKLKKRGGSAAGSRSKSSLENFEPDTYPPTLHDTFFDDIKGSDGNSAVDYTSDLHQPRGDSESVKGHDTVEVRVIYILNNPFKGKDYLMKIVKDRNQGIMVARSISNRKGPSFLFDMSKCQDSFYKDQQRVEGKMAVVQYERWAKDKKNPTGLIKTTHSKLEELEKLLLTLDYGIPLEQYPDNIESKLKEDRFSSSLFESVESITSKQLENRKDYRSRLIISIESDYFVNKEITFSIQKASEDAVDITFYLPDIDHYIKLGSVIDLECRKRKMAYNLPLNEYPMLPTFLFKLMSFETNESKLAVGITIRLEKEKDAYTMDISSVVPTVEKCMISISGKFTYEDCKYLLKSDNIDSSSSNQLAQKVSLLKELYKSKNEDSEFFSLKNHLINFADISNAFSENLQSLKPLDQLIFNDFIERETNGKLGSKVNEYNISQEVLYQIW